MTRTPAVASNRKTWTWSGWVKRGKLGAYQRILEAGSSNADRTVIGFQDTDVLEFFNTVSPASAISLITTQVFRDPSAWYHIVVAMDTTQATASNRTKFYINGVQVTSFGTANYVSQNADTYVNSNVIHRIGISNTLGDSFDGYLADVNFVDGQALTPNYFGATSPATGVWQPNQYKGSYGTNGFYLPMNIEVLQKSFTKSLRFRSSASAYLNRTPATAGNRKTWTWSGWVKRGALDSFQCLIGHIDTSAYPQHYIRFNSNNTLSYTREVNASPSTVAQLITTQVFRDPSAWYHIVVVWDTTQATANNRMRMYVNGSEITAFSARTNPTQNSDGDINNTIPTGLGAIIPFGTAVNFFDGYLAEVNFVDGLALEPGYFGQIDTTSGAWQPVGYTGLYGTNGFYLPFTNTTSTTTLGFDASGRNNNWTTNNISLTAGSTYDSMTDVPTLTSATEANYCVINPLSPQGAAIVVSAGNLQFTRASTGDVNALGSLGMSSGKWYWEVTSIANNSGTATTQLGIASSSFTGFTTAAGNSSQAWVFTSGAFKANNNVYTSGFGSTWSTGDVLMIAFDADAGKIWFGRNGTFIASGNPAAGTNEAFGSIPSGTYFHVGGINGSADNMAANFGQRPFAYTPPANYLALNAYNM
jgi:hypothetical protein